jgi:hypothetical protein
MSAPRYSASQFPFGESVSAGGQNGTVAGWDSSGGYVLLELEDGSQNYFHINKIQTTEQQS